MAVLAPKSQPRNSVASNTFTPRIYRKALAAALGAVVAGLVLTAGQAKALVVSVGGLDYDVTTFTGTYNDNASKFNTPGNGGVMPWWGNSELTYSFASTVGISFGFPNLTVTDPSEVNFFGYGGGPMFGGFVWNEEVACGWWNIDWCEGDTGEAWDNNELYVGGWVVGDLEVDNNGWNYPWDVGVFLDFPTTWAQAALVDGQRESGGGSTSGGTASVPGPLPILGLAAAFGFSRKLRKRIEKFKRKSE